MGAKRLNPEYITFDKSRVASVVVSTKAVLDAWIYSNGRLCVASGVGLASGTAIKFSAVY